MPMIVRTIHFKTLGLALAGSFLAGPLQAADENTLFGPPRATTNMATVDTGDADLNAIQLAGISNIGGQSMFNLIDPRSNKNFWISIKGTANGFTIESYEAASDTVVVLYNNRSRALQLRQTKIASMPATQLAGAPMPNRPVSTGVPTPVIHTPNGAEITNPKTPQEIAQAETEARNLVSDLLEISMQERARQKALREAALKQQGGQPAPAATHR